MGGNGTTVTVVGFAGGATTILFWILGFFAPEFAMAAPSGAEAAATTVLVGLLCYFLPFEQRRPPDAPTKPPPGP
jgi:hypothetical protein